MAIENLGITYSVDEKNIRATWKLRTDTWADVDEYVESAFKSSLDIGGTSLRIGYTTLPGKDYLVLRSLNVEPHVAERPDGEDSAGLPTYSGGAILTLEFTNVEWEINGTPDPEQTNDQGPYMTHDIDGSIQVMRMPLSSFRWEYDAIVKGNAVNDNVPDDIEPPVFFPIIRHKLTWHRVLNPPLESLYEMLGTVNSNWPFLGHGQEQVMFANLTASSKMIPGQVRLYELGIELLARRAPDQEADFTDVPGEDVGQPGWQHFYRPEQDYNGYKPWQRLVYKEGLYWPIYISDFRNLLTLFDLVQPETTEATT